MAEVSVERIAAALEAISTGIQAKDAALAAAVAAPAPSDGNAAQLQEELEVERATNARLVGNREQQVAQIERLETRVALMSEKLETAGTENRRLEQVIAALQANNDQLRTANSEHQDGSTAVNAALAAELDHLRATRVADRAELDEILGELAPMVKEA